MSRLAALAMLFAALDAPASALADEMQEILVVTVTKGFRHDSIAAAEVLFGELASESDRWRVDFARTDDELGAKLHPAALGRYDLVVFANTSGELPLPDREALLEWIRAGGAFLGVHAASDTLHDWPGYAEMLGGEFLTHGPLTTVTCKVDVPGHPAVSHLAPEFVVLEEIYEFADFDHRAARTLIHLDRHPQSGEPGFFPLAWWKSYGHGRVLYSAFGHRDETWNSVWFRAHLRGAIEFLLSGEARRRPARR